MNKQPASRRKCNLAAICQQRTDEGTTQPASKRKCNITTMWQQRTDEGTTQPTSRRKCNLTTTRMCQQRTDGGTTQPTRRPTSQLCANKEQMKEPHNQPADENATSLLCANKEQTKGTMHKTSQQTKMQPRNYVRAKNRRRNQNQPSKTGRQTLKGN